VPPIITNARRGKPSEKYIEDKNRHDLLMAESARVITDPEEIAKIAAECTPPSEIRARHGLGKTYERGLFKNRVGRRGYGNGRQKNIY
jgi:hypothetical protein